MYISQATEYQKNNIHVFKYRQKKIHKHKHVRFSCLKNTWSIFFSIILTEAKKKQKVLSYHKACYYKRKKSNFGLTGSVQHHLIEIKNYHKSINHKNNKYLSTIISVNILEAVFNNVNAKDMLNKVILIYYPFVE